MFALTRTRKLLVALAVAGAAFGIAGAVQASIPDSNGVAHGCYYVPPKISNTNLRPGALRLIDTDKGQQCASDEAAIDLATPQYVQSVATSTVNQTAYMIKLAATISGAGIYVLEVDCGTGYVATDPWVQASGTFPQTNNWALTENSVANNGELNGSAPDRKSYNYFSVSGAATFPFSVTGAATCIDGRVFGQAGATAPATSSPGGSVSIQKLH